MKSVYVHMEGKKEYSKQILQTHWFAWWWKIHAILMKLSNNTHSDFGFSYQTVMNNQSYTIHSGITWPHQFSLGNIPTMTCITDNIGEGWDDEKIAKFFNKRNNIANGQEEVRSKHFEHAYIILSTMTKIKLTSKKGKWNLFTIECYMPSFEPQNQSVRKQHATMFKNEKFTFHPQKVWYFPCCINCC